MTHPSSAMQRDLDSESPDIESSSDAYAARFAGPTGAWMLAAQEKLTRRLLAKGEPVRTILDVGGGHGQLAIPLSRAGFGVTVLGSDATCAHRLRGALDAGALSFATGKLLEIPFGDRSFDATLSFRILPHSRDWERLVAELCRVARHRVIVDYPTSQSVNRIAPWLFEAKRKVEASTRYWRSFRHSEVDAAFAACGFVLHRREKQFFLPMVIHRMLKCRPVSSILEGVARNLGLTRLWGSPVIAEYRREEPRPHKEQP